MGRAPCCDKVGLKKGPWTPEEDQILISFIQQHGHSNWRALPKQAGLLRCGKSCRLRWINYLRPDIKRGNFTKEEEDTIIQLHEMMGNRWSAIAARLPGRTDNEIKNVWHTHLKKRLQKYQTTSKINATPKRSQAKNVTTTTTTTNSTSTTTNNFTETMSGGTTSDQCFPNSPQQSYTSDGYSSVTEVSSFEEPSNMSTFAREAELNLDHIQELNMDYEFPIIDDTFWSSEDFSFNESEVKPIFGNVSTMYNNNCSGNNNTLDDNMDFWLDVFVKAGGVPEF